MIILFNVQANRDESGTVDMAKAQKEAQDLFQVWCNTFYFFQIV